MIIFVQFLGLVTSTTKYARGKIFEKKSCIDNCNIQHDHKVRCTSWKGITVSSFLVFFGVISVLGATRTANIRLAWNQDTFLEGTIGHN